MFLELLGSNSDCTWNCSDVKPGVRVTYKMTSSSSRMLPWLASLRMAWISLRLFTWSRLQHNTRTMKICTSLSRISRCYIYIWLLYLLYLFRWYVLRHNTCSSSSNVIMFIHSICYVRAIYSYNILHVYMYIKTYIYQFDFRFGYFTVWTFHYK